VGFSWDKLKQALKRWEYTAGILGLIMTVGLVVAVICYWEEIERFGSYGYPFVFLVSFFAGCSLPNPFPYIVVVFTLSSVLNPAYVGLVSGVAAGIGGTLVYIAARGGSKLLARFRIFSPDASKDSNSRVARFLSWMQDWAKRRGSVVVFFMSAMFNPLFLPMTLGMAVLRFQAWKFFLWCWAGNTVKSLFVAYCGYYGLGSLLRWAGVGG
jgi:membrane protein YqaA with SNARE-associated domain